MQIYRNPRDLGSRHDLRKLTFLCKRNMFSGVFEGAEHENECFMQIYRNPRDLGSHHDLRKVAFLCKRNMFSGVFEGAEHEFGIRFRVRRGVEGSQNGRGTTVHGIVASRWYLDPPYGGERYFSGVNRKPTPWRKLWHIITLLYVDRFGQTFFSWIELIQT